VGLFITFLVALAVALALLQVVPVLVYAERKLSAFIQDREGPNRVHLSIKGIPIMPKGLLQPLADAIKLMFKEDLVPTRADKFLFMLAPVVAVVPNAAAFCVIPFGDNWVIEGLGLEINLQVCSANAGILVTLALSSLAVYALAFGGWAANSKYPLMGGIRATAQVISYEIALGLALISVLLTAGTLDLQQIVRDQSHSLFDWNVFSQPVAFIILFIAAFAENNRLPFDLPEAEPELVGGYHTEYSGLKFSMFFMGEYLAMVSMSAVVVTLFLGGWSLPLPWDSFESVLGAGSLSFFHGPLTVLVFVAKMSLVLFFYIWVRWSIPRFRYDQLMDIGWKKLIPLALVNVAVTALVLAL
jgi:NADH-quinone oxidoreductase subunit H